MRKQLIEKATKIYNTKVYNAAKSGEVVSYTNLMVDYPAYKNSLGDTVVKVYATYNNFYSNLDGKRVSVAVPIN